MSIIGQFFTNNFSQSQYLVIERFKTFAKSRKFTRKPGSAHTFCCWSNILQLTESKIKNENSENTISEGITIFKEYYEQYFDSLNSINYRFALLAPQEWKTNFLGKTFIFKSTQPPLLTPSTSTYSSPPSILKLYPPPSSETLFKSNNF